MLNPQTVSKIYCSINRTNCYVQDLSKRTKSDFSFTSKVFSIYHIIYITFLLAKSVHCTCKLDILSRLPGIYVIFKHNLLSFSPFLLL